MNARQPWLSLLVVAAALVAPGAPPAAAAEFHVNTVEDVVDAAPGDGQSDTGERLGNPPVPACSLRAALAEAQATTEDDVVHVPAGHYLLTLPRDATYPDGYLRGGALRLAYRGTLGRSGIQAIALRGAGSSVTVIEQTTEDHVLIVHNGGMTGLVAGLTLRGGRALKGTGLQTYGGGILNHGDLTLRDAVVEGNEATGDGGGIFSHDASLRIRDTRISENRAGGSGGGIAVGTLNLGGGTHVLDAERLTLSGNRAASGGGLTFRAWARELSSRYGLSLPESNDYVTVAGLLLGRLGTVPTGGETVEVETYRLSIMAMTGRRITRVRIEAVRTPQPA